LLHELHSTQYYRNGEGIRFITPVEWLVEGMRRWRIHRLSKFVKAGRALDIGCGSGRFLRGLRNAGWEVAGIELNDEITAGVNRVHGLVVETSMDAFTDKSFDLITITHVLEHIRDPQEMLTRCARLLRPGGIIAIAVPNLNSWQARLTREKWFHLDLPRHLWHFSETWLSKILHDLGFAQIEVRRLDFAHNTFGWMQSLLNVMGIRHNRLYSFLSSDDLKKQGRRNGFAGLCVSIISAAFLFPLAVILSVIEAVFHAGGTVEIIARISDNSRPDSNH
jgi:SAM-dependent methyltransferase